MKGVILQPGYLPWLGFFNQMILSDIFIFLDDVQYDRRGWRNRNRISGQHGPMWLTIPVVQKGRYHQAINETQIDNSSNWSEKQLTSIHHVYRKSQYFDNYFPEIQALLGKRWDNLVELVYASIDMIRNWLFIESPTLKSSDYVLETSDKTRRLVELCKKAGITEYISGPLCKNYMDYDQFYSENIMVWLHEYHHPEYRQIQSDFIPYLSTIDLVFSEGPRSREILIDRAALVKT